MGFLFDKLKKLFSKNAKPTSSVKASDKVLSVILYGNPRTYAFGFEKREKINYRYYNLKYKILKEGNIKQMALYIDRMDKLNELTYKGWILIAKEKED